MRGLADVAVEPVEHPLQAELEVVVEDLRRCETAFGGQPRHVGIAVAGGRAGEEAEPLRCGAAAANMVSSQARSRAKTTASAGSAASSMDCTLLRTPRVVDQQSP